MNGILNIYKEAGYTSFDVVARLRGILKQKKIGHTGTLDPDAVGVLPICLGNATKVVPYLTDETKEYIAVLRLGITTDTYDMTGNILRSKEDEALGLAADDIKMTIMSFLGDIEQIPPMYSAIKVNGKRLYELARKGEEIERKPRRVSIYELEILEEKELSYKIRIVCSKGTYIRSLCHDIGEALGCGGTMESLERTRVGEFVKENSLKLDEAEELFKAGGDELLKRITPADFIFSALKAVKINKGFEKALLNGNKLPYPSALLKSGVSLTDNESVRVYNEDDRFFGIYVFIKKYSELKPETLFL